VRHHVRVRWKLHPRHDGNLLVRIAKQDRNLYTWQSGLGLPFDFIWQHGREAGRRWLLPAWGRQDDGEFRCDSRELQGVTTTRKCMHGHSDKSSERVDIRESHLVPFRASSPPKCAWTKQQPCRRLESTVRDYSALFPSGPRVGQIHHHVFRTAIWFGLHLEIRPARSTPHWDPSQPRRRPCRLD